MTSIFPIKDILPIWITDSLTYWHTQSLSVSLYLCISISLSVSISVSPILSVCLYHCLSVPYLQVCLFWPHNYISYFVWLIAKQQIIRMTVQYHFMSVFHGTRTKLIRSHGPITKVCYISLWYHMSQYNEYIPTWNDHFVPSVKHKTIPRQIRWSFWLHNFYIASEWWLNWWTIPQIITLGYIIIMIPL